MSNAVAVLVDPVNRSRCEQLAERLELALISDANTENYALLLGFVEQRLSLWQTAAKAPGPVFVDFSGGAMTHRRKSGHNELLGRAVGVRKGQAPTVWDATAGLGRDSFVLADLGCLVYLCERSPIVAAMLADGIVRAEITEHTSATASRLKLIEANSVTQTPNENVDVIYLDPMFPDRKKKALVKKEMQALQLLPETCDSGEALLPWAMTQDVARVVVKRPLRAPYLVQMKPSHSISGKAVRFDVYVQRALA